MRPRGISGLVWGAFFIANLTLPTKPSDAANCVLYVRAETGVALYGAAGGWWDQAEGRYQRGQAPAPGAILVFKRTGYMRSGHVALVAKVVGAHEILVDHANWYHRTVSRGVSVIDTSLNHDWTEVAVMEARSGKYGRDNPTFGFLYPGTGSREAVSFVRAGPTPLAFANEYPQGSVPSPSRRKTHHYRATPAAPTGGLPAQPPAD